LLLFDIGLDKLTLYALAYAVRLQCM
jgi:hypothetical protein